MAQFILWFNMLGFTLLVASAALAWLEYVHAREQWLASFLAYQGSHALWTLFSTYVYFETVFLPGPIPWLQSALGIVRLLVSLAIAFFGIRFYLLLAGVRDRTAARIGAAVSITVLLLVVPAMLSVAVRLAGAANVLFNVSLAAASWVAATAILSGLHGLRRAMLPFLLFTMLAYVVLAVANAWFSLRPPRVDYLTVNVIVQGGFVILWSVIVSVIFLRRARAAAEQRDGLRQTFLTDFGITPREAEIISELANGRTSKQIGEKLFISQRTVETHIYNIYRKCSVANRVELVMLISDY